MKNAAIPTISNNIVSKQEKVKAKLLGKKFFPAYLFKITHSINALYAFFPTTSRWLAMKVLSIANRRKLSLSDLEFFNNGTRKTYKIANATFISYSYGEGPAILLLHGWGSNAARWKEYVHKLVRSGYKVVIVDAPGHGSASGYFLTLSLYIKGIKQILRSQTTWHAVITHSIAGLVSVVGMSELKPQYHPNKFVMMNTFATSEVLINKFAKCMGFTAEIIDSLKNNFSNYGGYSVHDISIIKHFKKLNMKSLLIYDIADVVVPRSEPRRLITAVPSLEYIQTKGLGHNLRSKKILERVVEFIIEPIYEFELVK